ncbi:MAG: GAF domain-containing sensor histidine kinase [Pseudomonadota bacterium]
MTASYEYSERFDRKAELITLRLRHNLLKKADSVSSDELWEEIACGLEDLLGSGVTSLKASVELFTLSPDETVCQQVWPLPRTKNLATASVLGEGWRSNTLLQSGDQVLLMMRKRRHHLMVARIDGVVDAALNHYLELAANDIADALWDRRERLADQIIEEIRLAFRDCPLEGRTKLVLEKICETLTRGEHNDDVVPSATLRVLVDDTENELRLVDSIGGDDAQGNSLLTLLPSELVKQVIQEAIPVVVPHSDAVNEKGISPDLAFAKLPVRTGTRSVIGLVCVRLKAPFTFNLGLVHVAQVLTDRLVTTEVERARRVDASMLQADRFRELIPSPDELRQLIDDPAAAIDGESELSGFLGRARHRLYEDLTRRAREMAGAHRTAIGAVDDSGERQIAIICPTPGWPDGMDGQTIPKAGQRSGVLECIRQQPSPRTYYLEDVDAEGASFFRVDGETKSAAYVPILVGNQVLGALAVEWNQRTHEDPILVQSLEALCACYGLFLNSVGIERQLVVLESLLKTYRDNPDLPVDYGEILKISADMLAVNEGAILIRQQDSGRYYFRANLRKPEYVDNESVYYDCTEDRDSSTVHCIMHLKSLRGIMPQLNGEVEAAEFPWKNKYKDNDFVDEKTSLLCVPIAQGDAVYGVIRLNAAVSLGRAFDPIDESHLTSVALRIADCLQYRDDQRKSKIKLQAAKHLLNRDGASGWTTQLLELVEKGVGLCDLQLRVKDRGLVVGQSSGSGFILVDQRGCDCGVPPLLSDESHSVDQLVLSSESCLDHGNLRSKRSDQSLAKDHGLSNQTGSIYGLKLESNGNTIGTLIAASPHENRFGTAEKRFLGEIGEILSEGILTQRTRLCEKLDSALRTGDDEATRKFLRGEKLPEIKRWLLGHVFDVLNVHLQPERAVLLLPDSTGKLIVRKNKGEVDAPHDSSLYDESYGPLLGRGYECELRLSEQDAFRVNIFSELKPHERQQLVYLVQLDSGQRGFLCLLFSKNRLLHSAGKKIVAAFLEQTSQTFMLAKHVKDAQLSLPLMLLGVMASRLQHDAKTPFSLMIGLAEDLLRTSTTEARKHEIVSDMKYQIGELQNLLSDIQRLNQEAINPPRTLRLQDLITPAIADASKKAYGQVSYAPNGIELEGKPQNLRTALYFVIRNALEAIRDVPGGYVNVETYTRKAKAVIEIIDNGIGMDTSTEEQCFDAGFTTKENGTGFGLSAAYLIIVHHGGMLTVENNHDGAGVTCRIVLPNRQNEESL